MSRAESDTLQLLEQWHRGDRAALEDLLRRDLPWIQEHVHRRLGRQLRAQVETQDLVQEALLEFLEYGPRFLVADRGQFRALLARIAENVIRGQHHRFRAQKRDRAREARLPRDSILRLDPSLDSVRRPSEEAQQNELQERVRLALALVDVEARELLVERDWDQSGFAEMGQQRGISEDAARMRYHRAQARLAEVIRRLERGQLEDLLREEGGETHDR